MAQFVGAVILSRCIINSMFLCFWFMLWNLYFQTWYFSTKNTMWLTKCEMPLCHPNCICQPKTHRDWQSMKCQFVTQIVISQPKTYRDWQSTKCHFVGHVAICQPKTQCDWQSMKCHFVGHDVISKPEIYCDWQSMKCHFVRQVEIETNGVIYEVQAWIQNKQAIYELKPWFTSSNAIYELN